MKRTVRKWATLGAAVATATAAHAGASQIPLNSDAFPIVRQDTPLILAAGEGEGGGEHSYDEADYLSALGQVEGHLTVGVALYAMGEAEQAKTHMKHPEDELYGDLKPEFEEKGLPGFAAELTALAEAVNSGAAEADVQAKFDAVIAAIDAHAKPSSAHERAEAVTKLVRKAGEEYDEGVKDGAVIEAHEYQDAYGFVEAAKRLAASASDAEKAEYGTQFEEIAGYLNGLDKAWPDISGKSGVETDASLLAGAAARIELVALQMD
jgi:hypothetical protein